MRVRSPKWSPPVMQTESAKPTESQVQILATWVLAWPCVAFGHLMFSKWINPLDAGQKVSSFSLCKYILPKLVAPAVINSEIPCPKSPAFSISFPLCGHRTHLRSLMSYLERHLWTGHAIIIHKMVGLSGHGNSIWIPTLLWGSYLASLSFIFLLFEIKLIRLS